MDGLRTMRLEELTPGAMVRGLVAGATAKVIQVEWFGDRAVKVTFEGPNGTVRNRLVYRSDEDSLELGWAGMVIQRRRRAVPTRVRSPAHPTGLPVRSLSGAVDLAD